MYHRTYLMAIINFAQKFVWLSFDVTLTKILAHSIMLLHAFLQIIPFAAYIYNMPRHNTFDQCISASENMWIRYVS